jgi:hypothetical protein
MDGMPDADPAELNEQVSGKWNSAKAGKINVPSMGRRKEGEIFRADKSIKDSSKAQHSSVMFRIVVIVRFACSIIPSTDPLDLCHHQSVISSAGTERTVLMEE